MSSATWRDIPQPCSQVNASCVPVAGNRADTESSQAPSPGHAPSPAQAPSPGHAPSPAQAPRCRRPPPPRHRCRPRRRRPPPCNSVSIRREYERRVVLFQRHGAALRTPTARVFLQPLQVTGLAVIHVAASREEEFCKSLRLRTHCALERVVIQSQTLKVLRPASWRSWIAASMGLVLIFAVG